MFKSCFETKAQNETKGSPNQWGFGTDDKMFIFERIIPVISFI